MTHWRLSFLLLPLVLLVSLGACKRKAGDQEASMRTVILLSAHASRAYEMTQGQFLARLAFARENCNMKALDAKGDSQLQVKQFAEAMAEKPEAILVTAVEAGSLAPHVSEAVKAGILVIGLGESSSSLPCTTVLKVDQRELGRLAGELTVQALTRKAKEEGGAEPAGRVVELRGDDSSAEAQARHEGFMEAVQKASGVVLVHDAPANWSVQGGKDRIREALRLQTRFDVVYAQSDAVAFGAASVLGDQRDQVLVIGTDGFRGDQGGWTLVTQGAIDASIYQPPLVDLAWLIIERRKSEPGFQPKPSYRVNGSVMTPRNVEDFRTKGPPPLPAL